MTGTHDTRVNPWLWLAGIAAMAVGVFCFGFGMDTDTAWLSVLGFIIFPLGLLTTCIAAPNSVILSSWE